MDRIRDRLITIILILLIIGIIAGIGFFIYYINNSTVDDEEIATENKVLNICCFTIKCLPWTFITLIIKMFVYVLEQGCGR